MTIEPGIYQIKNHASWTTLDETTDGAGVIHGWQQTNEPNQYWEVSLGDDGNYAIHNIASRSFLSAEGAHDASKVIVSRDKIFWHLDQHPEGWVYITQPDTGLVVDLDNGNADDGTSINLWGRNDDFKHQQWFFERV
ncbi:hypothetical protein RSOLAG1IB_08511 [Rhizoctonia solani AG-1 IB]|uniref:Ricin B lectin domain-containing protein n=2 Tax=Rhizoctonia solani TaxID=456999 RepID=M5BYH7_THACB|nr:unnamed protein product [Rhizoctonia solani]CCO32299.1 hypothetical protein BN14_06355 [Rhizoctonia solani AG-1 IB]CEL58404.1 hypothetical protein RSOLAG1IB_08511 [Rhizoctonia solani AG-1 IB]